MIIIPCYNEEEIIENTLIQLLKLLEDLVSNGLVAADSGICVINDGSSDKTQEIIEEFIKSHNNVSSIKLTNNFGQQAALMAGINNVNASIVVTIDADLQDDYRIIPDMVKKYKEGYEIVYGVRNKRSSDTFFKRKTAEIFYFLIKLMGVNLIHNHADFRLLSSRAVINLRKFKEKNIILRGICPLIGLKSCNVYYERLPRKSGKSKYSLKKLFLFAKDVIISLSSFPLLFISIMGYLIFLISIFLFIYGIFHFSIELFIIFIIAFTNSLILISLGIIGEYISKIYKETKNAPLYFIEKTINL